MSLLIEPHKSPEIIAGSDKDSDANPFADLDKDEDQTEVHVPKLQYSPSDSICPLALA